MSDSEEIDLYGLESLLYNDLTTPDSPTEKDFYETWFKMNLNLLPPIGMAIRGALIADRPAWVFASGYQATLNNAFPFICRNGWAAFAATEDASDPKTHPGTTLEGTDNNIVLQGHKSWVGHSKLVSQLLITVNHPSGDKTKVKGVAVGRNDFGVSLTHRQKAKFLRAMSQGFAHFEQTPVNPEKIFPFEPIRQFGRTEAKFVMLACAVFMAKESETVRRDRLISVAAAICSLIRESTTSRQTYGAIDREYQACVKEFLADYNPNTIPFWEVDKRLFTMYTERIQRRADYARNESST